MPRPTKYTTQLQDKTDWYVDNFQDTGYGELIPTVEGLAFHLDIHKSTIYDWETHSDKPRFSDALRRLRDKQGFMTLNGGMGNAYNPTIAKLVLVNNHGYSDKSEVTNKGNASQVVYIEREEKEAAEKHIDDVVNGNKKS